MAAFPLFSCDIRCPRKLEEEDVPSCHIKKPEGVIMRLSVKNIPRKSDKEIII